MKPGYRRKPKPPVQEFWFNGQSAEPPKKPAPPRPPCLAVELILRYVTAHRELREHDAAIALLELESLARRPGKPRWDYDLPTLKPHGNTKLVDPE